MVAVLSPTGTGPLFVAAETAQGIAALPPLGGLVAWSRLKG